MRGRVAVVTDSTAYLPEFEAASRGIEVVPVHVVLGGVTYSEGVDVEAEQVAAALRSWTVVTTSRPSPEAFRQVYEAARLAGAVGVLSVHLSEDMSGTLHSAGIAARDALLPVEIVDSRSIGMVLGYAAMSAADLALAGADLELVAESARRRSAAGSIFFYVDTLEYLKRGGRIGSAAALVGSALSVKPLLRLDEGRIVPLERVRTTSRALARLEEIAVESAGDAQVDMAVHHLSSQARAETLAQRLRERVPGLGQLVVSEVGAVVGAHVGPGMLAVAVSPRTG